jgi:Rrf2 family iron-sulfur cluster assembly transcriptional regulator
MPNSATVTAEASLDPDCRREVTPARVTAPGQATSVSSGAAVGGSGLVRVGARAHYAVVAMVDLARRCCATPTCISDIATCAGIPPAYLEQLYRTLRRRGGGRRPRGAAGGYCLARPPEAISVADVVVAVEGGDGRLRGVEGRYGCGVAALWSMIDAGVTAQLQAVSIAELAGLVPAAADPLAASPADAVKPLAGAAE